MLESQRKPTNQNHSNQAKKSVGPDTMFFDALRGRRIAIIYKDDSSNEMCTGVMLDWDKYGIVMEKSGKATGPIYVFKAALACIYPID